MTRLLTRGWTLFMLAVVALGLLGLGYALWFKVITISSVVNTGRVHASIERAFTDDDDKVDSPLDSQDTEGCVDLGAVDVDGDGKTSCDPAATGPDPKRHYDKDVARCDAALTDPDADQAGKQGGSVTITNGYPSYHCTAWFRFHNSGTIPVKLVAVNEHMAVDHWTQCSLTEPGYTFRPASVPYPACPVSNPKLVVVEVDDP